MLRRFLTTVFWVILFINLLGVAMGSFFARFPHREKLADCTANSFKAELKVATGSPYHLFIVLPTAGTNGVKFSGEVTISRYSQQVATLPIGSDDLQPSSWLEGQNTQILTWSQTNRVTLNAAIVEGQRHIFVFRFSEMPPQGSSVWLKSLARITHFPAFWMMEGILVLAGVSLLVWRKLSKARQ